MDSGCRDVDGEGKMVVAGSGAVGKAVIRHGWSALIGKPLQHRSKSDKSPTKVRERAVM